MEGGGNELDRNATRTDVDEEAATQPGARNQAGAQDWEVPSHAGRYIVGAAIGAGGMGVVYDARDPDLNRNVAIKFLHPERGAEPAAASRLLREAQAMAQLSHPNVVAVHDVGTAQGQVFIAMELIDGVTLREWLAERDRSWSEIWTVFRDAGRGLAAAHAAGIIHRDFKPANVLIDRSGRALVTDFGLARLAAAPAHKERESNPAHLDKRMTATGSVMGTPRYMAPEQHEGREADARSDQFAYCVALYEALYGEPPFQGEDVIALAKAVCKGELAPEPSNNTVPRWQRDLVLRGLSVAPADRHDGLAELVIALGRDPRARRRRLIGAIVAVAVLAGGGAVAGTMLASKSENPTCQLSSDPFVGVWDDELKTAITRRFSALGGPLGQDLSSRFTRAANRYMNAWRGLAKASCHSTKIDKTQSAELFDLKAQCLERRRAELAALTKIYASETKRQSLVDAPRAIEGLTPIDVCADDKALREAYPLPEDPSKRAQVLALQKKSSELAATYMAGYRDKTRTMALAVLAKEKSIGFVPVRAEAEYHLALAGLDKGGPEVEAGLKRAIKLLAQAKLDVERAEAWITLLDLVGRDRKRLQEATMMLPAVEAAIARSSDPTVEGVYHQRWARVLHVNGKIKEAEASSSKALDLLEKALGADHVRVAIARNDHALILRFAGKPDEALTYARDALRVVEAERGPNHPDLMAILNMIAMITKDSDPKSAKAMLLRAIEILRADKERVGGFDDGALQNTIGNTYVRLGEFQKAGASFHNALVIFEKLGGADSREARIMRLGVAKAAFHEQDLKTATKHVQIVAASYDKTKVPRLHINRIAFYYRSGRIAHAAGDTKSALSHFNNGLAVLRSVNPKHPASIMYQTWIARVLADSGDAAAARRHLDRALAPRMAKRAFHETDIPALTLLGQLFLDQRQPNKALELLEAAAKRVGKGTRIERLAEMRATLAQALIETNGDRQRALGLLKQALPWYTSRTTPAYKRHRDRLLAWMKKQKIPAP